MKILTKIFAVMLFVSTTLFGQSDQIIDLRDPEEKETILERLDRIEKELKRVNSWVMTLRIYTLKKPSGNLPLQERLKRLEMRVEDSQQITQGQHLNMIDDIKLLEEWVLDLGKDVLNCEAAILLLDEDVEDVYDSVFMPKKNLSNSQMQSENPTSKAASPLTKPPRARITLIHPGLRILPRSTINI